MDKWFWYSYLAVQNYSATRVNSGKRLSSIFGQRTVDPYKKRMNEILAFLN